MTVRVEFYGTARLRAGAESVDVEATSLVEAFAELRKQLPSLAEACFENGRLKDAYLASINGVTFATDPATALQPGDSLLILSADIGG